MTDERISELRALAAAATPGPWNVRTVKDGSVFIDGLPYSSPDCRDSEASDLEFIVASRTAIPELLDEIVRLKVLLAALGEPK